METHRQLTIIGLILLIITYFLFTYYEQNNPKIDFNYSYITGIAMLIVFVVSFALFGKERLKESKSKK